jgi:hypothetical protein
MAMSFPVALFVAFTGFVLAIAGASSWFTAVFTAGFRQRALRLVLQELETRAPNRRSVKLESRVHARWDALTELAQRVELDRDSVEGRDRALAVLVNKVGDGAFLDSIEQERHEHQEAQLHALGRRLSREADLAHLIERAE